MGFLSRGYDRKVAKGLEQLRAESKGAAAGGPPSGTPAPQELKAVPACMQKYLERAAVPAPAHLVVTVKQAGEFRFEPTGPWKKMAVKQTASPVVPAILWSATCAFKPLAGMRGLDSLLGGRGTFEWFLWGWLKVFSAAGPGPLDKSMLVRWLAETPGFPRAMLPSSYLRWEAVPDADNQAHATVTYNGVSASGIFTFDEQGLVSSFRSFDYAPPEAGKKEEAGGKKEAGKALAGKSAPANRGYLVRYRSHKMLPVTTAKGGTTGEAVFVPAEAEAAWVLPNSKETPYVKLRLEALSAE